MGSFAFNVAKDKLGYYYSLPAASDALKLVLLKASGLEADDTLKDYDDLASLLAASNDECTFTNYARKSITSVTRTVDDTNNWVTGTFSSQTFASAGGASNNSTGKAIVCYDGDTGAGTDADIVPLTAHDFVATTDGTDLIVQIATYVYKVS